MGTSKAILTTDRTLASSYNDNMFSGFFTAAPIFMFPPFSPPELFVSLVAPSVKIYGGGVMSMAPYGLRKIESVLSSNLSCSVIHPDLVKKQLNSETKFIGIYTMDPLGDGPATSTWRHYFKKDDSFPKYFFTKLMREIFKHKRSGTKVLVGGPGTWQLEKNYKDYGIDYLVVGEGEEASQDILNGNVEEGVIHTQPVPIQNIKPIINPSVEGFAEITRGCGRQCKFCHPTLQVFRNIPEEVILKEISVNSKYYQKYPRIPIILGSEDGFLFGTRSFKDNFEPNYKIVELVDSIKQRYPRSQIDFAHLSVAMVNRAEEKGILPELIKTLRRYNQKTLGFQMGFETASIPLLKRYMPLKARPYKTEEYPELVLNFCRIAERSGFMYAATVIVGFEGETEEDLVDTIDVVKKIDEGKFRNGIIVPLVCSGNGVDLKEKQTFYEMELLKRCWQINFRNRDYLASREYSPAPAFNFFSKLLKHSGVLITKYLERIQHKSLSTD
jgi:radical SAM superfamily enzyme YgiQ (UPF0313 family)